MIVVFHLLVSLALADSAVREVSQSSCDAIRVNLGLGMTTQIVLEQEPKVTLYADKRHFRVNTNPSSPRSLAIIPYIESTELDIFRDGAGNLPQAESLALALDRNFRTNLFVFFKNNNQLVFDLRFVEKTKADYIVKVTQTFDGDCAL